MSPRGRAASLPPADHASPDRITTNGLVVRHYNRRNSVKEYDFSTLPVAEPLQRSLAAAFASHCTPHRWGAHTTSQGHWEHVVRFAEFPSRQDHPPQDLDEFTAALMKRWRTNQTAAPGGYNALTAVGKLLRSDSRLRSGPVADELAVRIPRGKSKTQSYSEAEFDQIKVAARRMFRAALLRIEENGRHLDAWRAGAFPEGGRAWVLGEGLDILARTGDLPHNVGPSRKRNLKTRYQRAMGGISAEVTWQRLFLTRLEAAALAVLLLAEYGWNLSVISQAEVPRASPDTGEDGCPTYRIPLDKYRRGAGQYYESRNVTDDGASSRGRLITQALEATRFARGAVEILAPGTNLLVVWRTGWLGPASTDQDRHPPVGPFRFGVFTNEAQEWVRAAGFEGSPFRRGRRTVTAIDRREPAQHSQTTHDRNYALVDKRVQNEAIEVIAAGAEDAAGRARRAVLVAHLRDQPTDGDVETATADCSDFEHGPDPAPDGGCGASFLMCLGCENARVHPGHHPRLVHFHQALTNLRTVLPPPSWGADWGETHARLEDLKRKIGDGPWQQALTRVTDGDRTLIDLLLTGQLDY
ncbi:hypothetical protein ACFVT5_40445 [Streptomyces sp. NPDC058001]|uniref:hypothetical protein n=1 Tax=Streptomyces sp. NPDC058001 TaxID=3346300 RepID=UPI0036EED83E